MEFGKKNIEHVDVGLQQYQQCGDLRFVFFDVALVTENLWRIYLRKIRHQVKPLGSIVYIP